MKSYVGRPGHLIRFFLLFSVAFIAFALISAGCAQQQAQKPAETPSPVTQQTVIITPATPTPTPEATGEARKPSEIPVYSMGGGRRDPFVQIVGVEPERVAAPLPKEGPKVGVKPPVKPPEQRVPPPPINVTGIFQSPAGNKAILTGTAAAGPCYIVAVGEQVGDYRVKSIDITSVVLVWGGREFKIKLQEFGPYGGKSGTAPAPGAGGAGPGTLVPSGPQAPAPGGGTAPPAGGMPGAGAPR